MSIVSTLDCITRMHTPKLGIYDHLCVHDTPEQAAQDVANSPISDGAIMSTLTYHHPATIDDVFELRYDQHGDEIVLK